MIMHRSEFEKFAIAIRPSLLARAASVTGDADSAADIVQDCLIKLCTMRGSLDDYDSPEALAMTIVHRLALNYLRSVRTTVDINDSVVADVDLSAEEKVINSERADMVGRVLSMLPDAQQAILIMRHVDGLSNIEIARIIGSTEGAVRTSLCRARMRIAEIFTKHQLSKP